MGELKAVAESQVELKLVERVKEIGSQVYLAGLGLVTLVQEESQKQYDKFLAAGQAARGEKASADKKVVLVVVGVVETVKVETGKLKSESEKLSEKLKTESEKLSGKVKAESEKLKVEGEKLKADGLKLIDDLIAAGEKRKAA